MYATLILIGAATPSKITGDESKALQPIKLNPLESLSEKPTTEEVKQAVVFIADNMGLDENQLYHTIECESGFDYKQIGDSGAANNIAQFHLDTFKRYCDGNYHSAHDQLVCMAYMWKVKLQSHWSCYNQFYQQPILYHLNNFANLNNK